MTKKSIVILLCSLVWFVSADDFLAVIPDGNPELLAQDFTVVGVTGNGVLVLGNNRQLALLNSLGGRVLDYEPKDKVYYRVRLFDWSNQAQLARISRVLDFDGEEYLVAVAPEDVERLLDLRVMLGRVSLQGWVFKPVVQELPPVFSNPLVEAMVSSVAPDSVLSYVYRLQRFRTRYSTSDSCRAAAEWIRQKFISYGCDTVIMQNHTFGHAPNVIGIRYGTRGSRSNYAIICGHFDSYSSLNPNDAPGADDNASGTAAVIEACRVTQGYRFQYDLRFIAFSGEEFGLYGSEYYAGQARAQGDTILGVLNFDMIGYVDVEPENLDVLGKINNPPCEPFVDWFTAVADTYTSLTVYKRMVNDNQNSDHGPFWNNGYLAFCGIEDFWPNNPWYHTSGDSIGAGYNNNQFCTEVTRAGVAALATLGQPLPNNRPLLGLLSNRIDDTGGNNDGFWDPGESIGVYLVLKNFGVVTAHNVSATVTTQDSFVTIYQGSAYFGDILGGDTAVNSLPYLMRAATRTPREHLVNFTLTITALESTYRTGFSLQIGRYLISDPIPDNGVPPRYWAYDDIDTGYAQTPVFEWVEINTIGTRLTFPHNDSVRVISLPPEFGVFRFYGREYDSLSISADGWLCPGYYRTPNYNNQPLPGTQTPPGVIAVNWDDLYPNYNNTGFVYYYFDTQNHRLIIEYDSVCYYQPRTLRDKFQVIIYDTTVATPTGDNVIVFQYLTANGYTSSTVGIQDQTRQIAIGCLYNGGYAGGAAPILPGRAIKFTTVEPTGVKENGRRLSDAGFGSEWLCPNPIRNQGEVRIAADPQGRGDLRIYDRTGRKVARLKYNRTVGAFIWDTRKVGPGVYFLRTESGKGWHSQKVVVVK